MSDVISNLRVKEKTIQDLRAREQRRQGQEDQLRKQLKDDFGLDTVESAEEELKKTDASIQEIDSLLQMVETELDTIIEAATKK